MSRADARRYMDASAARVAHGHLVETVLGRHLFVADGSRLDCNQRRDGKTDIVVRNAKTGSLRVMLFNGLTYSGWEFLYDNADLAWTSR